MMVRRGVLVVEGFRRACSFLTVCPIRASDAWTPETLGSSMVYYPLVGALIGLVLGGLFFLLSAGFALSIVCVLLLAASALITGGLHMDGLSDTIDGLNGSYNREDALRIFKDSHVGAMAVIGMALTILLKYACLTHIPADKMLVTLVLTTTLSRYGMVQLACFSPYARASGGVAQPFVQGIRGQHFSGALVLTLALVLGFGGWRGLVLGLLVGLVTLAYQVYFRRRLGGITGDVLGASNELNETLVLLVATLLY